MVISSRLILLNTTKVGEKSLVLHCLCKDYGRRSFIVSAGKSGAMALYQPLNILDAELVENSRSELWRLRGVSAVHPLGGIRGSMGKTAISLFMSEVLYRVIHDGDDTDGLFDWCERSILTLEGLEADFANFHLRWLLELCSVLGFSPEPEDLAPFAGGHYREIVSLLDAGFEEFMLFPLNGRARGDIADIVLRYLSAHIEANLNIRSLSVLSELFR